MSATRFHAELNGKESDMAQPMYDGNGDLPDWFDDDLHWIGIKSLSDGWQSLSELKPLMGEYAGMTNEVMRDLCALGIAMCEVRAFGHYEGCTGGKSFYKLSDQRSQSCMTAPA